MFTTGWGKYDDWTDSKIVQRTFIAKPINGTCSVILEDYTAECTDFEHFLREV